MRSVMSACSLALALSAACSGSSAPDSPPVVGSWAAQENLQPRGSMQEFLAFAGDGTFSYSVVSYGLYGGNDVSAYIRMSGTYEVDGDQLTTIVKRTATWDSFYGPSSPETVDEVQRTIFDHARFRIVGRTLTLDYITYPADAPVPTSKSFMSLRVE